MTDTQDQKPFEFSADGFREAAQNDPELTQALDTARVPAPTPRNTGAPVASLWDRIKGFGKKLYDEPNNPLDRAVERGALDFGNSMSNTIVGGAVGISKKTGLYKLGRTPEEQAAFLKAWDHPTNEVNPLQTSEDQIDRWSGPKQGGGWGLVSGVTQFALGSMTFGKAAEGILGGVGGAGKVAVAVRGAVKNAAVDMTSFNQHLERLANLVEGTSFANPLTKFLAAKEDDSDLEANLKGAAEGLLIGSIVHLGEKGFGRLSDLTVGKVKAAKLAKAGDEAGAAKALEDAQTAAVTPRPTDVAKVVQTEEGHFEVHPLKVEQASEAAAVAPKFATLEEAANVSESLNLEAKVQDLGFDHATFQDADNLAKWKQAYASFTKTGDLRDAMETLTNTGVNPKNFTSPDDILSSIQAIVDVGGEAMTVARNGLPGESVAREETARAAMELNSSWKTPDEALAGVSKVFGDTDQLPQKVVAARLYLHTVASKVSAFSKLADAMPENSVAMKNLADGLDHLYAVHSMVSGTTSSIGRALDSFNIDVGKLAAGDVEAASKTTRAAVDGATEAAPKAGPKTITEGLSRNELRDLARAIFMGDPKNPGELLDALRGTKEASTARQLVEKEPTGLQKARDVALSWRMEAMLSAVTTHAGNAVSNTTAMMLRPAEYWWAGARTGNQALKQMGADMLAPAQMIGDANESLQMAFKAFKTGENVLEGSNPFQLPKTADLAADDSRSLFGRALTVGLHLPSRMLMSSDEFFKQMNYRMNARAQIMRQARAEGVGTDEMARRLGDMKKFMFKTADDGSTGEAVNAWALNYAKVSTFTNDLGQVLKGTDDAGNPIYKDSMGAKIQNMANDHTLMRLMLPFVKTPVNIFRFSMERTPGLNRITQAYQEALRSGDPERIAIENSKAQLGGAVWATALGLAYNKQITGKGPSDPKLRDELKAAGWQPYSIKVGDRYVSLRRADPVFTSFSIAADMVEASSEMMAGGDDAWKTIPAGFIAAVSSSVTSKAFLQGLQQSLDAVSSGKGNVVQSLWNNTVGSFIPNALRKGDPNDGIMETRSLLDELMARTPGFSEMLEPKRDLFGSPVVRPPGFMNGYDNMINPFTVGGKVMKGDVMNELVKLGKSIPTVPETIQNGQINLADRDTFKDRKRPDGQYQSPYDRQMEILSASGAKQHVIDFVQSDGYKTMSDDEKYLAVSSIIHGYQDMAYGKMLAEYPSVRAALGQEGQLRGAAMQGGDAAVNAKVAEIKKMSQLFVKPKHRYNPAMPE